MSYPTTPFGYSNVPPGHLASVVTCLEMRSRPPRNVAPLPAGLIVERRRPELDAYRDLFRRIGSDWLWTSRLYMDDEELRATLDDENVEVYPIRLHGREIGLLELDFRAPEQCELAFVGLDRDNIGRGFGRLVIDLAIDKAWSRPIRRLWIHTCTFDHPRALGFYIRSGFEPYAFQIEVLPDPRLSGHLPLDAAPHVPMISPGR